ncbi:uncharacterized protein [Macrobrachium rosenbergii]|uniref:uncharacterized protein isoform X2 n=1 Tax=Macrobrachium rosenbergii TaxID=79674 RepID=UPI0034D7615D
MATPSKQGVECCYCFESLSSKQTLMRHKRRRHPNELKIEGYEKPKKPLICRDCDFRCLHIKKLIEHYRLHNRKLKIGHVGFSEEERFMEWKKEIEKKTKAHFVLHRGRRETHSTFVKNYYCNRSGFFISVDKGKRVRLKMSSKINYTCSAFLRVVCHKFSGKVEVEFCLDHTHEFGGSKDKNTRLELRTELDKAKTPVKIELVLPSDSNVTESEDINCVQNTNNLAAITFEGESNENIGKDCVKEENCKVEYISVVRGRENISDSVTLDICENQIASSKSLQIPPKGSYNFKCSNSSTAFHHRFNASSFETVELTRRVCQHNAVVVHKHIDLSSRSVKGVENTSITHSLEAKNPSEKDVTENCAVPENAAVIRNSSTENTKKELLRMMNEIIDIITQTSSSQTLNSLRNHIVSAHAVGKYLQSGAKCNTEHGIENSGALNKWECLIQINKE